MVDLTPSNGIFSTTPSRTSGTYYSDARSDAIYYNAALCISGVLQIVVGPVAPPLTPAMEISGALSLSGCIALLPATLLPGVNDAQLGSLSNASGVFSPAVFWVPTGALLGGNEGARFVLDKGSIVFDLLNLKPEASDKIPYYLLDPRRYADEYLLYRDVKSATSEYPSSVFERPNDENAADSDPEVSSQEETQEIPDISEVMPPGSSDGDNASDTFSGDDDSSSGNGGFLPIDPRF